MLHSAEDDQDDVQVIRQARKNRTAHITSHQDPSSGKPIVLWGDVLRVFPDALYLQRGKRIIPFMKGSDFKDLDPPRIAAIPNVTLDVIVHNDLTQDAEQGPSKTLQNKDAAVTTAAPVSTVRRNPAYGDELAALENYNHIDPPSNFSVRRNAAYGGAGTAIDKSSSTRIEMSSTAALGRSPAYGDELVAIEDYTHIDRPNVSARGPQLHPDSLVSDTSPVLRPRNGEGNLYNLDPPRITAITNAVLDIVAEDSSLVDGAPRRPQDSTTEEPPQKEVIVEGLSFSRNSVYGGDTLTRMLAEQGNLVAQYETGRQYECWLNPDYIQAKEWYLKAAKQGHLGAQCAIGHLYEKGLGRPVDLKKAFEWYLKAAETGYSPAQTILGEWYWNGSGGVPEKDQSKSFEWYLKAAEGGNPVAQRQVGEFYCSGWGGVLKDELQAFVWFMKAAVQGNATAQLLVAEMYCSGCEGVSRDYKEAKEWYLKAGEGGEDDAWLCPHGIDKIFFQELSPEEQQHELQRQEEERQQREQELIQAVQQRRRQRQRKS